MSPNEKSGQVFPSQARLHDTYSKAINASVTLSDLSITLPDKTIGVEVRLDDDTTLRIGFVTADANNGGIKQYDNYTVWDSKNRLNTLALFTGEAGKNVSIFVYVGV
jgi:hypothetical protein